MPISDADQQVQQRGDDADEHRDARGEDHAGEDVAPVDVRAAQEYGETWRVSIPARCGELRGRKPGAGRRFGVCAVLRDGIERRKQRAGQGGEHGEGDDAQADGGGAVAQQIAQGLAHYATRTRGSIRA